MTEKESPLKELKGQDVRKCRDDLIEIIDAIDTQTAGATALKVKVEAIKSLGRFHHALQVEKVTAKAGAIAGVQTQQLSPDVKARVDKEIDAILGRGTEIQDTPALS